MKLENRYSENVIERGEKYLNSVLHCIKIKNSIYGQVQGSNRYKTEVNLSSLEGDCSCPYDTNCKHAVALYLTYQKGRFWDAEDFIKNLDKMSHNELKEMILSKLKENPDWIKKHNLKKSVNKSDFLGKFKKNFSSELISEAEAILEDLSFEQQLELFNYISRNYESLSDKLLNELENTDEYYDYDDEEYDSELFALNESLSEILVRRALSEDKIDKILKNIYLRDEIIKNADSFYTYGEKIKKTFEKHECLGFLLNLKAPNISEIKLYVDDSDKSILYDSITEKRDLIKEIAKSINDKTLLFTVAIYEKDQNVIIENFNQFDNAIREYAEIIDYLSEVIDVLKEYKFKNAEVAKKFLTRHVGGKYNKEQIRYLASQINDFDFVKRAFNREHIETDVVLLERLAQLDKEKAFNFIKEKRDLLGRHWSDIIPLFNFLKKYYSVQSIKDYIKDNQDYFKTSSHLKKHLKEECGIFISQKEGGLIVEVK